MILKKNYVVTAQSTITVGGSIKVATPDLQIDWFGFSSFSTYKQYFFLVEFNPVELDSRRTWILPSIVSVICMVKLPLSISIPRN